MRRMSFALTTDAVLNRTKTVTRRLGWAFLRPGDRLLAVDKLRTRAASKLGIIEVTNCQWEPLASITDEDVTKEGFPGKSAEWFVDVFEHAVGKGPHIVNRIEFRYVDEARP